MAQVTLNVQATGVKDSGCVTILVAHRAGQEPCTFNANADPRWRDDWVNAADWHYVRRWV